MVEAGAQLRHLARMRAESPRAIRNQPQSPGVHTSVRTLRMVLSPDQREGRSRSAGKRAGANTSYRLVKILFTRMQRLTADQKQEYRLDSAVPKTPPS
jgi:hypothetical protein